MFFISEEFLRKYEAGEAFGSTLDEVTGLGETLFPEVHEQEASRESKGQRAARARTREGGGS